MFISTRSLILSITALLCAAALGAQERSTLPSIALAAQQSNAVPAFALGPQTINSGAGDTVTLDFGLAPLVHGPYTLTIQNVNSQNAIFVLNGMQILNPVDLSAPAISTPVTLDSSNTLEVTFTGGRRNSQLIVSISGWEYAYAGAYANISGEEDAEPDAYPSGSLDWREKGAVTPVKNQGTECPASWAFSTTGVVEGYYQINHGRLNSLSEQQIIDCSGARSCFQGNTAMALNYVLGPGLTSEADYPYTARLGACKNSIAVSRINGINRVPIGNENALGAAVDIEPVSVVINGNWFSSYTSGVANPDCESKIPVFASALIVGYGYDGTSGLYYWLVKNSMGTSWGEGGYFRIVRGQNKCGIADYALYVH